MKISKVGLIVVLSFLLQACFLTKVVSVPMRLGGAVISIVPGAGDAAHDAIDTAADAVDSVPI